MPKFKPGDQILYMPGHVEGNMDHQDCEEGFVVSVDDHGDCFCRYWSKHSPGELRTKANSERTSPGFLVRHDSRHQEVINYLLELIQMEARCNSST